MRNIGQLIHRTSQEIDDSPWGLQYTDLKGQDFSFTIDKIAEAGVKWVRYGGNWGMIEKEKGKYDFEESDAILGYMLKKGLKPFICLGKGNPETEKSRLYMGANSENPLKTDMGKKGFYNFVNAMVGRYGDCIRYWQILNEPNFPTERRNDPVFPLYGKPEFEPNEYAEIVLETSGIIRENCLEAKVIAGVIYAPPYIDFVDYTRRWMEASEKGSFDIFTYHPYHHYPEMNLEKIIELIRVVKEYAPEIEIWQDESGMPSSANSIDFRSEGPWGQQIQAKWLLRRFFTDQLAGAQKSAYFMIGDIYRSKEEFEQKSGVNTEKLSPIMLHRRVGVNTKGLLAYSDWREKPAYMALKSLTAIMDDRYKAVDKKVVYEIKSTGVFSGIGSKDTRFPLEPFHLTYIDGKDLLLFYWLPWPIQESIEPAVVDLSVETMEFRDPVWVNILSGEVYEVLWEKGEGSITLRDIPLCDYPCALTEKSRLRFKAQ